MEETCPGKLLSFKVKHIKIKCSICKLLLNVSFVGICNEQRGKRPIITKTVVIFSLSVHHGHFMNAVAVTTLIVMIDICMIVCIDIYLYIYISIFILCI